MTVIVSVKINDGVVMASDSAGSMPSGQVYAHANKIANLCEGLPVGAMSTGSGGIGNESVETLLTELGGEVRADGSAAFRVEEAWKAGRAALARIEQGLRSDR